MRGVWLLAVGIAAILVPPVSSGESFETNTKCVGKKLDIFFIIDKSASIDGKEISLQENCTRTIINGLDIADDKSRIGIILFSNDSEFHIPLGQMNSKQEIAKSDVVPRPFRKVGTLTHLGLQVMIRKFTDNAREGVKKLAIVITDGRSTAAGDLLIIAKTIHKVHRDITVIAVGTGKGADQRELNLIASGTDDDNVYNVISFPRLAEIKDEMIGRICEAPDKDKDRKSCPDICIENGISLGLSRKEGETVKFECSPGFELTRSTSAVCRDNGKWAFDKTKKPQCTRETLCPLLLGVTNGKVKVKSDTPNQVGSIVEYSCHEGYELKGSSVLTCLDNGKWNKDTPVCKKAQCKVFKRLKNGHMVYTNVTHGSTVTFKCKTGYNLVGAASLTCENNNRWSGSRPKCKKIKQCYYPRLMDHGTVDDLYVNAKPSGEEATFRCHDGFKLVGQAKLTCNGKKWSAKAPTCTLTRCAYLPFLMNGQIERNADNTKMVFSCNDGYELKGESTVHCVDAVWDKKFPTCKVKKACKPLGTFEHGIATNYAMKIGTNVKFACHKGFKLNDNYDTITCNSDGKWSNKKPRCKRDDTIEDTHKTCDQILDLNGHGKCVGNFTRKSHVYCSCDYGWRLLGAKKLKCRSKPDARWTWTSQGYDSHNWSLPVPTCVESRCPQIGRIQHGYTEGEDYTEGKHVRFFCRSGYKLDGKARLTCSSGKWSEPEPKCIRTSCGNILSIKNGVVEHLTTGDRNRAKRVFRCNPGYERSGKKRLTCRNGHWTAPAPTCVKIPKCKPIQAINNGHVHLRKKTDYVQGAVVKLKCRMGFMIEGAKRLECLANKKWNFNPGKCVPDTCPTINNFRFGNVTNYSNAIGSKVLFSCAEGYKIQGKSKIRCLKGATWSHPIPVCNEIVMCPSVCLENGAVKYHDGKRENQKALFACNDGFTLLGNAHATCNGKGEWDNDTPKCVPEMSAACRHTKQDVIFVVDVSEKADIDEAKRALKVMSSGYNIAPGRTNIGVIAYSKVAKVNVKLNKYKTIDDLLSSDEILNIQEKQRRKERRMDKALDLARTTFKDADRDRVVIMLTKDKITNPQRANISATLLKSDGVVLLAIDVNSDPSKNIGTLRTLVTDNDDENIFRADNWKTVGTEAFTNKVVTRTCGEDPEEETTGVLPSEPTEECVDKQLDIYIVVDKSKSIKDHELVKARRCVKYVLNNFDVAKNKTRIGLVSYHKYAITEFDLDAYSTIQELNALTLVSRPVKVAGTKTAKALSLMLENFKAEAKPGREKIGILVTDGKATEPVKDIAAEIEKTDVKLVAIGVGSGVDEKELELLATGEGKENVIVVKNFDDMRAINSIIAQTACTA